MLRFRHRLGMHSAKILIVFALSLPALVSFVRKGDSVIDNRPAATFPARPATWQDLLQYPSRLDSWINDHFGLRGRLVKLNNQVRYWLFRQFPTHQVIQGRNGRIFLAAHGKEHALHSAILIPCGAMAADPKSLAAQINNFFSAYSRLGLDPKLIVVPSAPVLYPEDLPAWLEARCAASAAPVPQVLRESAAASVANGSIYYPAQTMRSLEPAAHAIPKTWFHWAGMGPRVVAQESAQRFWSIPAPRQTVVVRNESMPSDISHLFEGVRLSSEVEVIDYAASKIDVCEGVECFPGLGAIARKLGDVSHYRNERAPGERLVLFSDSYGRYVAGAYAPFFREVMHFSTNSLSLLSPEELAVLRETFMQGESKPKLLFVYHDFSVITGRVEVDQKKMIP